MKRGSGVTRIDVGGIGIEGMGHDFEGGISARVVDAVTAHAHARRVASASASASASAASPVDEGGR